MTPEQLAIRQVWAEKQASAYAKMVELDGGIGMLAQHHPVMVEDMHAWMDLTQNDHADTVLALLDLVWEQRAQIDRVRALHVLHEDSGKCAECTVSPYSMHSVKYPCPTIAALTATEATA